VADQVLTPLQEMQSRRDSYIKRRAEMESQYQMGVLEMDALINVYTEAVAKLEK